MVGFFLEGYQDYLTGSPCIYTDIAFEEWYAGWQTAHEEWVEGFETARRSPSSFCPFFNEAGVAGWKQGKLEELTSH
jgi:hypothetical protein